MVRDDEATYGVSYWPSVSDLFMTLFIVAVALVGSVLFVFLPNPADKGQTVEQRYRQQIERLEFRIGELQSAIDELTKSLTDARASQVKALERLKIAEKRSEELEQKLAEYKKRDSEVRPDLDDKPPIIVIADADKQHFFASGSAEVSTAFESDLRSAGFQQVAEEILRRNPNGELNVDTLEIIGHTDGIAVARRGNLDAVLPGVLSSMDGALGRLTPGSNNDLGLLRALAIKQAWRRFVDDHPARDQLEPIALRTYSAGQTLPVEPGRYSGEDPRARRIELRLTKLQ